MKIKLNRIEIVRFRGLEKVSIDFKDSTRISGWNETGKTTIFDAFLWVLFGKDSQDRKDYEIKMLVDGKKEDKYDHEVKLFMSFDEKEYIFVRTLHEKWQNKRGESTAEFVGNETLFSVNGVPCNAGEYSKTINGLIPEETFKLLTNPFYFNSLDWKVRREMLFNMAGKLSDDDVAAGNKSFQELLSRHDNIEKYRLELSAKKKLFKEKLTSIPIRIDEVKRGMPVLIDVEYLNSEFNSIAPKIEEVDRQIADKSETFNKANAELIEKRTEHQKLIGRLNLIEVEQKNNFNASRAELIGKIDGHRREYNKDINEKTVLEAENKNLEGRIGILKAQREKLLETWHTIDDEQVKVTADTVCPACKRPFDPEQIELHQSELTRSFNESKVKRLEDIEKQGKQINEQVELLSSQLSKNNERIEDLKTESDTYLSIINEFENGPESKVVFTLEITDEMRLIKEKIKLLEQEIKSPLAAPETSELLEMKKELTSRLDEIKKQIAVNESIWVSEKRISELEEENRNISQAIADLEKDEFVIDEFIKTKISMIENLINSKFDGVKFRMYNQLINGGEEPTCETLIEGVPFPAANHAAQITSGISIINTFARHMGISAPVFVDNAEAVCELLQPVGQLIKLEVSRELELTVTHL